MAEFPHQLLTKVKGNEAMSLFLVQYTSLA